MRRGKLPDLIAMYKLAEAKCTTELPVRRILKAAQKRTVSASSGTLLQPVSVVSIFKPAPA
jgi:hypothetical protein